MSSHAQILLCMLEVQVILACGSAVDAMVQSGVARYLEFKTLGAVFIAQQQQV
jgi:RAB protein geranylgeranyltransferase component A